jgi:hypothetical protein
MLCMMKKAEHFLKNHLESWWDVLAGYDEEEEENWIPNYNLPKHGDLILIDDFIENVESGFFTDLDGAGDLIKQVDGIWWDYRTHHIQTVCDPRYLKNLRDNKGVSHVVWFNV